MSEQRFSDFLSKEFRRRRESNTRYSLRAYAAFLEVDHSTLSQVMSGSRKVPVSAIRKWARKLGLGREEVTVFVAAEHVPDSQTIKRQEQLRNWSAEAMSIISEPVHLEMLRLTRLTNFHPNSIWLSKQLGLSVDEVNIALSRLLRLRLLSIDEHGAWHEMTGLKEITSKAFLRIGLARVREMAKT